MRAAKAVAVALVLGPPALAAAVVREPDCAGLDAFDGSVLLHRDLQVLKASDDLPLAPDAAFTALAVRAVQTAGQHLQTFESKLEGQRREFHALREYLQKVQSKFGQHGSLFSDMQGLVPTGALDEADKSTGKKLLGMLKDDAFSQALHRSVHELDHALDSYSQRTDKHLSSLLLTSANTSEAELPRLINKFFAAQQHVIATVVERVQAALEKALEALPSEYAYVPVVAGPLLKQLSNYTNEQVARSVQQVADSNGTTFCEGMDAMLIDQVIPMLNETMLAMPTVELFAQSSVPAAASVMEVFVKELEDVSKTQLTPLRSKVRGWVDQACALMLAAAPTS